MQELLVKNLNFKLANTFGKKRDDLELELTKLRTLLFDLQSELYAENKNAVLIVLQGMGTSGKDGTIKHVISALNPAGAMSLHSKNQPP